MPIATGRATQKRKVKKPGQAQITTKIINIAQRIIPIITVDNNWLSFDVGAVMNSLTNPGKRTDDGNYN